jgi:PRTRC genetic system protein C
MSENIITLERVFKFGATELADFDPDLSPADILKQYEVNYPLLAQCTVGEPAVEGDRLVYPVIKPDVKTKG